MAKENPPTSDNQTAPPAPEKKPSSMKKLIMIGIPVFLLQVVVLYFVAAKFLVTPPASAETPEVRHEEPEGHEGAEGPAQSIFVVKDIIVNPAGTNGTRFLLMTVAFEVSSPGTQKELEQKEIQVRDALNTILGTMSLEQLASTEQREALRTQIAERVGEMLKTGSVTSVYFSKFIIQ
jgi:flagellar protein FliL